MSLTTKPEAILSNIHALANAVSDISDDLEVRVVNDPENKRAASIIISDNGRDQTSSTAFNVVGSRFVYSLEILDTDGNQQFKLASGHSDKDVQAIACDLAHGAGFHFD